jgi:hypothetical protein
MAMRAFLHSRAVVVAGVVLATIPAARAAAAAGDPSLESVRKELGELKSGTPGAVGGPATGLGAAAAGLAPDPNFGMPSPPPPSARDPRNNEAGRRPGAPERRVSSSGWLLDALEENERRSRGPGEKSPDDADSAVVVPGEEREDEAERLKSDEKSKTAAGTGAAANPLSSHMADWLRPEEFNRLRSISPELVGAGDLRSASAGTGGIAMVNPTVTAGLGATEAGASPVRTEIARTLRETENPFLAAIQAPRPAPPPTIVATGPPPGLAVPVMVPPPVIAPPPPLQTAPPAPGADDRKFFPQLKRF